MNIEHTTPFVLNNRIECTQNKQNFEIKPIFTDQKDTDEKKREREGGKRKQVKKFMSRKTRCPKNIAL